jgi:hypothetical protein
MKQIKIISLVLFLLLLTACSSSVSPNSTLDQGSKITVTGADSSKSYTRDDLEALPVSQSTFKDVTYIGVSLSTLLQNAGFDVNEVKAVKATAVDGYNVNYDTSQVFASDVIVAYAQIDGEMTADDGSFRMVLPNAEGKLNVRMLTELQVIK